MIAVLLLLLVTPLPSPTASFGPSCDPASMAYMEGLPVGSAITTDPQLSNLVTELTHADLLGALDNADSLTLFAPVNPVRVPASLLTYHVVPYEVSAAAGTHPTWAGHTLTVTGTPPDLRVNGTAHVLCGNVRTLNATVYYIDSVLMPG